MQKLLRYGWAARRVVPAQTGRVQSARRISGLAELPLGNGHWLVRPTLIVDVKITPNKSGFQSRPGNNLPFGLKFVI